MSPEIPERSQRLRRPCPRCHCGLRRVHRRSLDRIVGWFQPRVGRYRCLAAGCGWEGLLPRHPRRKAPALPPFSSGPQLLKGLVGAATISVLALCSAAAIEHIHPTQEVVQVGPHEVVRGFSHDGDKLPADHPLLAYASPVSDTDEVEPAPQVAASPSAAASASTAALEAPLTLRRHCAWGQPGRNPYLGSVELALRTARLPESVVARIAADVHAHRPIDRLSIGSASIRADGSGRRFDPKQVAMTYGRTLCVDTRVNFKKNHVERADLYEAPDAKGNIVAVMVPDVCGNVSVLSEVAEGDDGLGADAARQEGHTAALRRMPRTLVYDDGAEGGGRRQAAARRAAAAASDSNAVPAPGTLACALLAMAVLAAVRVARAKSAPNA